MKVETFPEDGLVVYLDDQLFHLTLVSFTYPGAGGQRLVSREDQGSKPKFTPFLLRTKRPAVDLEYATVPVSFRENYLERLQYH